MKFFLSNISTFSALLRTSTAVPGVRGTLTRKVLKKGYPKLASNQRLCQGNIVPVYI
jgi:hypothetical protein